MPQTRQLPLPARPASVRVARVWVREILGDLGRKELVPSAMLGVSELVTNAIIHGQPPLSVSVLDDPAHPVIEVHDGGAPFWRPMSVEAIRGAEEPATIGRGLTLVAMSSERWGAGPDTSGEHTVVWFEPAVEMHDRADLSPVLESRASEERPMLTPEDGTTIVLTNLPVRLYAEMRRHQYELRRELGLLVFEHPDQFPIAGEVIAAIDEASAQRRPGSDFGKVETAAGDGAEAIDLTYSVRPSTPRALLRLRAALEACYDDLGEDLLLTVRPEPEIRDFQDWFFGEVIGQAAGAAANPWRGPLFVSQGEAVRHAR